MLSPVRGSYVGDLLLAIFAGCSLKGSRLVVILAAYCDESLNADRSIVSIGGAFAEPLDWLHFSSKWQRYLDDWGLDFFHMADFERGQPPYDWPPDVRHDRLNKLLDLINTHGLAIFNSSVPREWFDRLASPTAKRHWKGIFGLAAQTVFITVGKYAGPYLASRDATLTYFFERGIEGWGQIEFQFNYVAENQPELRFQTIVPVPKKGFPPVQAADLIVYECNKEFAREMGHPGAPPKMRYPMERLNKNAILRSYPQEGTIHKMSDAIDQGMREAQIRMMLMGKKSLNMRLTYGDKPKTIEQIAAEVFGLDG